MLLSLPTEQLNCCVVFSQLQTAEELISNIRTVKSFVQEDREKARFDGKMDEAYEQARQVILNCCDCLKSAVM